MNNEHSVHTKHNELPLALKGSSSNRIRNAKKRRSREKRPFSIHSSIHSERESFSVFDVERYDLFELLFVSFDLFHFNVQNSNRKRAELKITIALNGCDFGCVPQCIQNIFFSICAKIRIVFIAFSF